MEHAQALLTHCPFGPHCELETHVPQVPWTQARPPPHWLFDVHAVHDPATQTSPLGPMLSSGPMRWLQSAHVEHAAQTSLKQLWPPWHCVEFMQISQSPMMQA
jgi:hypothetical protein